MSSNPDVPEEQAVAVPATLAPSVPNKELCEWAFSKNPDGSYDCKLCKATGLQTTGRGDTNLITHLAKKVCMNCKIYPQNHSKYKEGMQPAWKKYHASVRQKKSLFGPVISQWTKTVFGWTELVVLCNNSLRICEDPVYRRHVKLDNMSRKTLRKYIIKLADIVGIKIKRTIGPGNCIADGWSCAGVHYMGIIHRWPRLCPGKAGETPQIVVEDALLSCQPLLDETMYDANSHAESLKACYELFGKPDELIVCLTLDNTNVNPATSRLMGVPMIGAYCHRLNLASRHWINEAFDGDLMKHLETINAVMKRASSLKARGRLKEFTPYTPQIQNKTRWTGYQDMAMKYMKMHDALVATGDYAGLTCERDQEDIDVNLKDARKKVMRNVLQGSTFRSFPDDMLPALRDLRKWFINIQSRLNLSEAMEMFAHIRSGALLKDHSLKFENRLEPEHALVTCFAFEQGVNKIITHETEDMNADERLACQPLLREGWTHLYPDLEEEAPDTRSAEETNQSNSPGKFMKKLQASRKRKSRTHLSSYIDNCEWITPTTVEVEQLFSKCSRVMTADRRKMHPRIFEAIVCLRQNCKWWDLNLVQEMLSGQWNSALADEYDIYDDNTDTEEVDQETPDEYAEGDF